MDRTRKLGFFAFAVMCCAVIMPIGCGGTGDGCGGGQGDSCESIADCRVGYQCLEGTCQGG